VFTVARWSADGRAAAIAAGLAPYAWRAFTSRMLARRVVGAVDRYAVVAFLSAIPGTDIRSAGPVEAAESGDERVDVLVRLLENRHWRATSLDWLCGDLTAALDLWQAEHESFHSGLRRLLDDR
jgi:hypothetical protein